MSHLVYTEKKDKTSSSFFVNISLEWLLWILPKDSNWKMIDQNSS